MAMPHPAARFTPAPHLRCLYGIVGGLALVSGLVASPFTPAKAAAKPGDTLQWGLCPKSAHTSKVFPTECATFQVPMDYKETQGKKITLTMSRMRAQEPRHGVIFTNPGGPGGHALNLWNWIVDLGAGEPLLKNYDLIAVQPRGLTNATALLPCTTEAEFNEVLQEPAATEKIKKAKRARTRISRTSRTRSNS